jgi:DNA-binding response OmpR family regulator
MPQSTDDFGAAILIVDDQDSNVRLLEHVLRRAGYVAVTSTTDPRAVCALHREYRYDLILLDLQMPRMNGFDVLSGLLEIEGEDRVRILVLSADPAQMVHALEAGATSFLSKPFDLAEVLLRVGLMLGQTAAPWFAPAILSALEPERLALSLAGVSHPGKAARSSSSLASVSRSGRG